MTDDDRDDFGADDDSEGGEGTWLITYADLVTLLLVFFVLLFSMSQLDHEQFTDSFTAIKEALGGDNSDLSTAPLTMRDASVLVDEVALRRQVLMQQQQVFAAAKYLQTSSGMKGRLSALLDEGKVTLRLPSEVLFASGSARLSDEGRRMLTELKDFFVKHADQTINIKGFTDDVPPAAGSAYRDNWELSAMRAVNVLRYLLDQGLAAERMTATGLADMQPLYPNSNAENRARNRRVEFVLEKTVG